MTSETKTILLTILAPTSIFLLAQAGTANTIFSSNIFSALQTSGSIEILIFSIWSLVFSIGGWYVFVDKKTFGLKKFAIKNSFALYILFLAFIILSIIFLRSALTAPGLF
jgi:hypothetical protein